VEAAPALRVDGVVVRHGALTALDGVSLDVAAGECVALVGESGAGKTTLLRCFNRLTRIASGTVQVAGRDAAAIDPVALRRRVGYVPQEGGLLPHWTVARNVGLVPWLDGAADGAARVAEVLALVGLPVAEFGARYPKQLSGGQRQRVAIARALAARPDVVLLDEPFGALDALTRHELREAFADLRARLRLTALLVTHDLAEAFRLADRVAVMRAGRIEQCATPQALRTAAATDYVRALLARAGVA
jgi:osmoprotectant transport system ATP-binding protein